MGQPKDSGGAIVAADGVTEPLRNPERPREALLIGLCMGIALSSVALVAMVSHLPWVFPSLGPTAFVLLATPLTAAASTQHTLVAHLLGVACGALGLLAFGLWGAPPDLEDLSMRRIGAIAVATVGTSVLMLVARVPHPPALATTLIVALGLIATVGGLTVMTLAVLALLVLARIVNMMRGYRLPLWRAVDPEPDGS